MSNNNVLFFNLSSKFIQTLIDTRRSDNMRDRTVAIAASVVKITHQPGLFSSTTLSRPPANFLHQTCVAGFVKHLSLGTSQSEWYLGKVLLLTENK